MKKKLLSFIMLFGMLLMGTSVKADDVASAKEFFNNYVAKANAYSTDILNYYLPNAKIIRQVVVPDGTLVNATTNMNVYSTQLRIGQATAKMRNYKNTYRNITVTKVSNGYKVSAERQPSRETYWLKTYQILQKQPNGEWKIAEELMQTKEQIFLKFADKK